DSGLAFVNAAHSASATRKDTSWSNMGNLRGARPTCRCLPTLARVVSHVACHDPQPGQTPCFHADCGDNRGVAALKACGIGTGRVRIRVRRVPGPREAGDGSLRPGTRGRRLRGSLATDRETTGSVARTLRSGAIIASRNDSGSRTVRQ